MEESVQGVDACASLSAARGGQNRLLLVGADDQTVVSEVTLEANQSLFQGPLYPSQASLDSDTELASSQQKLALAATDEKPCLNGMMDESSKRMDSSKMDISARAMSTSQRNRALAASDDITRLKFALASVRGDDAYAPLSAVRGDLKAAKPAVRAGATSTMEDYSGRGYITQEQYESNAQAAKKDGGSLLSSMTNDSKPKARTDPLQDQVGVGLAAYDNGATADPAPYQPRGAGAWSIPGISSQAADPNDSNDEPQGGDKNEELDHELEHELDTPTELAIEEGLAEAIPVEANPTPEDLQAAEPVASNGKTQHPKKQWILLALLALAVLIVLGVVVSVALTRAAKGNSDLTATGTTASEETIKDLERLVGVKSRIIGVMEALGGDAQVLENPDSAYSKALAWLLHEDELQLASDASNLLQRFVVALFYYSTTEDGPWTSCNPPGEEDDILCYYHAKNGGGLWEEGGLGYTIHQSPTQELLATRWLTGQHECQWAGLFCNNDQELRSIQLDEKNLTGTIPDEMALLTNLEMLSLSANALHGSLPVSMARLKKLSFLDLQHNLLSGAIPHDWLVMTGLQHINLSFNPLDSWTIPSSISHWSNLEYLQMESTQITGEIPSAIYSMANLRWVMLRGNAISGTIATEIGLLTNMEILSLMGNPMSGTIPSQIALMTDLLELDLVSLGLRGTIPEELYLSDYTKFNALILKDNQLSGTISTNIGRLSTLGYIYLNRNPSLAGTLPSEVGLLTKLQWILMSETQLSGTIPQELCMHRGSHFLSRVKMDCTPISDGSTPMACPEGCCTDCCNRETGDCIKTKYHNNFGT